MTGFDSAYEQVKILVDNFGENEKKYLAADYSEARVRTDFIDKFFTALGWDVNHNVQLNPYEQEVSIEKPVKVEGMQQKRADFAFFLAPNYRKDDVKFYVEAKKPARNLSNAVDYFQTCRYGWSAGTPLAILTDFEELHILDCRTKPDIHTILDTKRDYFHYKDYLDKEKFAKVYWLFSREAIANNSIEKYVEQLPKPRGKAVQKGLFKGGYQSIDEAFLEELDGIRNTLAKAFKKKNPHLGSDELTEMTQKTIDRLVFIRFLEDKQIEPEHYINEFGGSKTSWKDFIYASRKLDAKYNGIVFKKSFIDEKNFIEPDEADFSSVCKELSHVNSPYNFDLIPIHILGSIYERFLGKVVVATDKRVRIDEKPEVRKAGGVYYTPQYIVNYIVENTVGKLIDGKTPKEIAKLRFADISCGSGSFLITVFDKLLEHHKRFYQNNPKEAKSAGCYEVDGKWVLSLKQKQKILTNNIYGVDIDAQAVEVTQLSLYLKLLEDESNATAEETWVMFKEQILPSLSDNIICGNSLIGTDISSGTLFNWEEEKKLKPMNFEDAFPTVMKDGGFDAVVGNPPWGALFGENELAYLKKKHADIIVRMIDSFMYFTKIASEMIHQGGKFGLILPDVILYQVDNQKIRRLLIEKFFVDEILNLGDVFKNVTRPTCIIIASKQKDRNAPTRTLDITDKKRNQKDYKTICEGNFLEIKQEYFLSLPNSVFATRNLINFKIIDHINTLDVKSLIYFVDEDGIQRGISPDLKKAFIVDSEIIEKNKLEKDLLKPTLTGGIHIKKYFIENKDLWIIYSNREIDIKKYPHVKSFIDSYKNEITCSEVKLGKHSLYTLHRAREEKIFLKKEKIVGVITEDEIVAALDEKQIYFTDGLYLFGVKEPHSSEYILGVLNSRLMRFIYKTLCMESGRVLAQVKPSMVENLPIRLFNYDSQEEKTLHNKMVQFVTQMLLTKKELPNAKTDNEKEYLEKKCKGLDRQIDALVYELYGLTEEEIEIVEKNLISK